MDGDGDGWGRAAGRGVGGGGDFDDEGSDDLMEAAGEGMDEWEWVGASERMIDCWE